MKIALAAPCGLCCGLCPKFRELSCPGCRARLDQDSSFHCDIYKCCVTGQGLYWCFECHNFPCRQLKEFTQWSCWLSHADCVQQLKRMKRIGVVNWLREQERQLPFNWL